MLSVTASIIETIVIKTSVFAGQQLLNIVYYGGASLYNWYNPTLSETQLLQKEVKMLKNELFDLKEAQYKDIENSVVAFNDINELLST